MPGRDLPGGMAAGFAAGETMRMRTGMVLAHSLPPAPFSFRVSLASPVLPRSPARKTCSPHSVGWYGNTQVLLCSFTATLVTALRDEPVPGALQQCQPHTRATDLVIGLCKILALAKCSFTPEHLLELRHRHQGQSQVQLQHRTGNVPALLILSGQAPTGTSKPDRSIGPIVPSLGSK